MVRVGRRLTSPLAEDNRRRQPTQTDRLPLPGGALSRCVSDPLPPLRSPPSRSFSPETNAPIGNDRVHLLEPCYRIRGVTEGKGSGGILVFREVLRPQSLPQPLGILPSGGGRRLTSCFTNPD